MQNEYNLSVEGSYNRYVTGDVNIVSQGQEGASSVTSVWALGDPIANNGTVDLFGTQSVVMRAGAELPTFVQVASSVTGGSIDVVNENLEPDSTVCVRQGLEEAPSAEIMLTQLPPSLTMQVAPPDVGPQIKMTSESLVLSIGLAKLEMTPEGITLSVGTSKLEMQAASVTLNGTSINVGSGSTMACSCQGMELNLKGTAEANLSAALVKIG